MSKLESTIEATDAYSSIVCPTPHAGRKKECKASSCDMGCAHMKNSAQCRVRVVGVAVYRAA